MGGAGTGPEPILEDFWEESEAVTRELMEEVDMGLTKRSLLRIVCMRAPLPNPFPPYIRRQQTVWPY